MHITPFYRWVSTSVFPGSFVNLIKLWSSRSCAGCVIKSAQQSDCSCLSLLAFLFWHFVHRSNLSLERLNNKSFKSYIQLKNLKQRRNCFAFEVTHFRKFGTWSCLNHMLTTPKLTNCCTLELCLFFNACRPKDNDHWILVFRHFHCVQRFLQILLIF